MIFFLLPIIGAIKSESYPRKLTKEEEEYYLNLYATKKDQNARNKLIEHNLRLVAHIAKKYENTLEDVFIIGGESIYNEFINDADNIYLTEIDKSFKADTFFPTFDKSKYKKEVLSNLKDNDINYKHVLYRRLKWVSL